MTDITNILNDDGPNTSDRLLPVVYDELRRLASARMANEKSGQTLAATDLVHEAWLRLGDDNAKWDSRRHFFGAAAEAMRRILIDRARSKKALKRGGEHHRADFDLESVEATNHDDRILELDEALSRLAEVDPSKAQLVKLRYFAGCSIKDAAELMDISTATADRYWAFARAWLQAEMRSADES